MKHMILENSALTLIRLEIPGGGLNEVPHEARDPQELRASAKYIVKYSFLFRASVSGSDFYK